MAKKNSYLRGLTRAAYNAMQRYNRLAREDEKATLSPGKIKASARAAGITPFEWIRNAEESNLGPRVSAKVQKQIEAARRAERKAGKVPTSTAAIRRSIAEKAKRAKSRGKKARPQAVIEKLLAKSLDIVHPASVAFLATLASEIKARITSTTLRNHLSGTKYAGNKAMKTAAYEMVKDALYDFRGKAQRGEFASGAEMNAADQAIANMAEAGFVEVDLKNSSWVRR